MNSKIIIPLLGGLFTLYASVSHADEATNPIESCKSNIKSVNVNDAVNNVIPVPKDEFNAFVSCIQKKIIDQKSALTPAETETAKKFQDRNKAMSEEIESQEKGGKPLTEAQYDEIEARYHLTDQESAEFYHIQSKRFLAERQVTTERRFYSEDPRYHIELERAFYYTGIYANTPIDRVIDHDHWVTYAISPAYPGLCDDMDKNSDSYKFCTGEKYYSEKNQCTNSYGDPCGTTYSKQRAGYVKN